MSEMHVHIFGSMLDGSNLSMELVQDMQSFFKENELPKNALASDIYFTEECTAFLYGDAHSLSIQVVELSYLNEHSYH